MDTNVYCLQGETIVESSRVGNEYFDISTIRLAPVNVAHLFLMSLLTREASSSQRLSPAESLNLDRVSINFFLERKGEMPLRVETIDV